jgi:hypothetical protein
MKEDCWDAVAQYYLLTANDAPMGCVRFVDPGAFSKVPNDIPRKPGRLCFPMEEFLSLDSHIGDPAAFIEPTRFIMMPALRNKGAFIALTGTAYLYVMRKQKFGAVCMALPMLVGSLLKMGWMPLAKPMWLERYSDYGHPLIAWPGNVGSNYQSLFLEMEQSGVITI